MDGSNTPARTQILSSVMHHIDTLQQTVVNVPITAGASDLQSYLTKLLDEIETQPNRRAYSTASSITALSTCINSFAANPNLTNNNNAALLANRLMQEEVASIARHPNLNPIAKGSFLQFTYKDGAKTKYLGVKIEHSTFIDVQMLIRKAGLAEDRKLYKAVSVDLATLAAPNIQVYDTNGVPAAYWWKNFLELVVQRNDSENTKTAIEAVIKTLGILKSDYAPDHSLLRNAAIAAFKQKDTMRFDNFVDRLLANYTPIDSGATSKIAIIEQKLRQLPNTKNFDTQFELDPSSVPYRQRKIVLSSEISLTIKEGIDNLKEKIWASKTKDGKNVLVIQTENINGFDFKV